MMTGEHKIQTAKMLLLVATAMIGISSVCASESHVMQVQRYAAGSPAAQGLPLMPPSEAAHYAALNGESGQQTASDRSLLLAHKLVTIAAIKKLKKKKNPLKSHLKNPLKGLPLILGGAAAASAASAATAGAGAGAAVAGPFAGLLGPGLIRTPIPQNVEIPVWKVHKYNGIDIRPVRLSEFIPSPALPPPSEIDFPPAPKEVLVPEPIAPVYGPPESYPTPADTITFPESPRAAGTYGPPAQTYGPPAQTYGPPAQSYGVPQFSAAPAPQSQSFPQPIDETSEGGSSPEGLEALSNLGALTDLLPGGGDTSSRLPGGWFFNRFIRGPQPVEAVSQPQQSAIQNLLGRIPIISSLTNFGGNPTSHVSIPPLPELPALPDIQNVRGANAPIPNIPHIRLPTKYVFHGSPYLSIRAPQDSFFSPPESKAVAPVAPVPPPAPELVQPEPSYPLPLEQPQPNPQYNQLNSYGQPLQTGYYVTPVVAGPPPPQFALPYYANPVSAVPANTYGLPASTYGQPGDAAFAASEIDECAEGSKCAEIVKTVAVPEGQTRAVMMTQSNTASRPVFKKEAVEVEDMARSVNPQQTDAKTTQKVSAAADTVDAQPSTATEDEE